MNTLARRIAVTALATGAACGLAVVVSPVASADVQYGPTFTGNNASNVCHADIPNEQQYAAPGYSVYCEPAPGGGERIVIMTFDQLIPQTVQGWATGSANGGS
jgi:hypothetical protein